MGSTRIGSTPFVQAGRARRTSAQSLVASIGGRTVRLLQAHITLSAAGPVVWAAVGAESRPAAEVGRKKKTSIPRAPPPPAPSPPPIPACPPWPDYYQHLMWLKGPPPLTTFNVSATPL